MIMKNSENNGMEEIGFVTPNQWYMYVTPVLQDLRN